MMNEKDAVALLNAIESVGIYVWLDGGWGVDALVGLQTRPHNDIDVFVEKKNTSAFINFLTSKGYCEQKMTYTTEGHSAWIDSLDHIIDLHLFEFGESGMVYFEEEVYPSSVLNGTGIIGGVAVRCLNADAQMLYHQGYDYTEKDVHDVLLLNKTFGIDIPIEYKNTSVINIPNKYIARIILSTYS
jgi:lincosamide nucleotidyltransferase A/C/D/E